MTASIADRYAAAKIAADRAAAVLEKLRKEIVELGVETIEGEDFVVKVGLSERSSLDQTIVKGLLTPGQIVEATKVSVVTTVRVAERVKLDVAA